MPTIELKNVNKMFGNGISRVKALTDINFTANAGEVTLILGPSGSGKSTFLTITGGLRQPSTGEVFIDGNNIENYSAKELDHLRLGTIGFILQSYNLIPYLTVSEQFKLVDKIHPSGNLTKDELDQLMDELGIVDLVNQYPDHLSGGQKQRVAIARALYPDPPIILADEPTAALDSNRVIAVGKELQSLAQQRDKTVVIVTHDLRLKQYADKIFEINDGKIKQVQ